LVEIDEECSFNLEAPEPSQRMCKEWSPYDNIIKTDAAHHIDCLRSLTNKRRRGRGARFGREAFGGGRQRNLHEFHELRETYKKDRESKVLSAIVENSPEGGFKTFHATLSQDMVYRILSDSEDGVPMSGRVLSSTEQKVDTAGVADSENAP
jgi:hypothetical protein